MSGEARQSVRRVELEDREEEKRLALEAAAEIVSLDQARAKRRKELGLEP